MGSRTTLTALLAVITVALGIGIGIGLSLTSRFSGAESSRHVLSIEHTALTTLVDLNSVDELRVKFNNGDGSIRVVLLLSPT